MNTLLLIGSLNLFLSVVLGAFGAHALKKRLSADMMTVYQTGVQYHMIHGLGILIVALIGERLANTSYMAYTAGWLLFAGIILFSGSLYALSFSGVKKLGAITPLGGLAFLAGWLLLAVALVRG